jgi:release factor glutamine methyltransferase
MRLESLLAEAGTALRAVGIHNGAQEARWLLLHVLAADPERSPCCGGAPLDPETECDFRALLRRRLSGEPLQYVMGSAEFYGLELQVGAGVLIPRPETERLVDFALAAWRTGGAVCDLCTGSGAIALALAREQPAIPAVYATDLSPTALNYARRNAARLGLSVTFVQGDLFAPLPPEPRFQLVTANPPYVSPEAYAELPAEVSAHEPRLALWAAEGGLAIVRRIAQESPPHLVPGGMVLCEIGCEQGLAAAAAFSAAGFGPVDVRQDYTQRDRVVVATWPGEPG